MKPALNSHKRLKTTKQRRQKKVKKKEEKKRKTRHKDVKNSSIRQEKPTHTQQGAQQKKVEQAEGGGGGVGEGKEEKGNVDAAFSLLRFALPNERRSTHKSNAKLHYFVISARPIHCHSPSPRTPTACCPLQGIKHCQK